MGKSKAVSQRTVSSSVVDVFAPPVLSFAQNMITFGEQVAQVLVILNYPTKAGAAWLSRVAGMPGVVCSVHLTPADPGKLINNINKSIGELTGILDRGGNALTISRAEKALHDAHDLLKKIDQEQQQVFDVAVCLLIIANDMEALGRRVRQVQTSLAAAGMRGRNLMFLQEQGLLAAGPWCHCPEEVFRMAKRNMPSETVAASFPFTASGVNDGSGIIIGKDAEGGLVLVDIWKRGGDRTNSNWTILAKPGTGKSFTVKMMLLRELAQGARVVIIDPEREYYEMCRLLNGAWINCSGGEGRINPLQVRPMAQGEDAGQDEEDDDLRELSQARSQGALALHLHVLKTFFRLYLSDLSDIERVVLQKALREVYKQAGITWDTDPASVSAEDWPTFKTLYKYVADQAQEDPETWKRLALFLEETVEGADAALWNGPTTINPEADLVVFDVHDLQNADDTVRRAQYFNVLSFAWHLIEKDRQEKTLLVVDEAWLLVDPQTPQTLSFLRDTSKRIRKYMGGLIVISQNVVDFLDPAVIRHGQALLDNPCYKLLLAQGEKDLQALAGLMNLSEAEVELLATAKRGEGLLVAGTQRIKVQIEAAPYELPYLTGGGK